jgi:hypothetical protein
MFYQSFRIMGLQQLLEVCVQASSTQLFQWIQLQNFSSKRRVAIMRSDETNGNQSFHEINCDIGIFIPISGNPISVTDMGNPNCSTLGMRARVRTAPVDLNCTYLNVALMLEIKSFSDNSQHVRYVVAITFIHIQRRNKREDA